MFIASGAAGTFRCPTPRDTGAPPQKDQPLTAVNENRIRPCSADRVAFVAQREHSFKRTQMKLASLFDSPHPELNASTAFGRGIHVRKLA
jgi:hypothetical protein